MTRRFLPVLAAFAILAAAAVAHGLRTDRWGTAPDLKAAADRLADVPMKVGDWEGVASDLDPRMVKMAQAAGYLDRQYVHYYTKNEVTVLVLCGRPGPISVHTPDVCYAGAGFVPGPAEETRPADGHTFWTADFTKPGPTPEKLRISWAWSDGGSWAASASPRTAYAGGKILYKMYLVRRLDPAAPAGKPDVGPEADLLKALLPELQKRLGLTTP